MSIFKPTKEMEEEYPLSLEDVIRVLTVVANESGWRLDSRGRNHWSLRFGIGNALTTNMKFEVWMEEMSTGYTWVRYRASAMGMITRGPVNDTLASIRGAVAEGVEAILESVPSSSSGSDSAVLGAPTIQEALTSLEDLRRSSLITDEEYEAKRKEILDRL